MLWTERKFSVCQSAGEDKAPEKGEAPCSPGQTRIIPNPADGCPEMISNLFLFICGAEGETLLGSLQTRQTIKTKCYFKALFWRHSGG